MAYKRYSRHFIAPFAILVLLVFTLAYSLIVAHWYISSILILALIIAILIFLKNQLDATNEQLTRVFEQSVKGDHSLRFATKRVDSTLKALYTEINKWQEQIQHLQQENQRSQTVTNEVLEHLPLGVFLMDKNDKLVFSNKIAQQFLNYRAKADYSIIENRAPYFFNHLSELRKAGQLEMNLESNGEKQRWNVKYRKFTINNDYFELFITSNVQAQLEKTQGQLSEEIMHVLTHEIMNSISPVHSLIDTINIQLRNVKSDEKTVQITKENFDDIKVGAEIIKKRSNGLMKFVERYALLARLPYLDIEAIEIDDFLNELMGLVNSELKDANINLDLQLLDRSMRLRADRQMLTQVIINLVKNAKEALQNTEYPSIVMSFSKGDGYNYFSVADNGEGVNPEISDKIFLPFFTTRQRGSGIGLSLSRKIINAHNGRLYLRKTENGSEFRIELPD